jgi:hypothetical protein
MGLNKTSTHEFHQFLGMLLLVSFLNLSTAIMGLDGENHQQQSDEQRTVQ